MKRQRLGTTDKNGYKKKEIIEKVKNKYKYWSLPNEVLEYCIELCSEAKEKCKIHGNPLSFCPFCIRDVNESHKKEISDLEEYAKTNLECQRQAHKKEIEAMTESMDKLNIISAVIDEKGKLRQITGAELMQTLKGGKA